MVDIALHAFTTLFVVIDPLGLVPVLLALTAGMAAADRRRMALKGALIASLILLAFGLIGERLLGLLGIGLAAFRIAGGMMLLLIALEMVFERRIARRSRSADELREVGGHDDLAVFPLAIPLLSGPGAIASIMLLMDRQQNDLVVRNDKTMSLQHRLQLLQISFGIRRFNDFGHRRFGQPSSLTKLKKQAVTKA